MINKIIDISHYNNISDFDKIKDDGIIGIFHKATEGLGLIDAKYLKRKSILIQKGFLFGSYHYIKQNGIEEAKQFLEVVNHIDNELLVLDYEVNLNITECEKFVETIFENV